MDDDKVQKWIDEAIEKGRSHWSDAPIPHKNLWYGWGYLYDLRNDPQKRWDKDNELACAEHYMFARFVTTCTGPGFFPLMHALIIAYSLSKLVAFVVLKVDGNDSMLQAGSGTLSPPSWGQVYWGERGALRGAATGGFLSVVSWAQEIEEYASKLLK